MTGADLTAALADHFDGASISDVARMTGGASRETWRVRIDGRPCVAQRQRAGAGAHRSMAVEARVLAAVAEAGVPVPQVVAFVEGEPSSAGPGGDIIVSAFTSGETIPRRILRDDRHARARRHLVGQFGAAAARIHAADARSIDGLPSDDVVADSRRTLDEIGHPHPAFELAWRWLEANRPPPPDRPTLVHGDFRLGNVIVDDHGLAAVVDWELAHLGDPMEDLGWMCAPAWRFGAALPAAGLGPRDELLAAYSEAAGMDVDRDAARWWEICGIFRWGVMCMMQVEAHRAGEVRSHELAAIGRRVCETEHDLFRELEGRW